MSKKHSKFSASSSDRWMNCPGSIKLSEGMPNITSEYAIEGTHAHTCLEYLVLRYKNIKAACVYARQNEKFNDEMIGYAVSTAHTIMDFCPSPDAKLIVEERINLNHIAKDLYGTLDYAWIDLWNELIVMDYKYGQGKKVEVVDQDGNLNPQLMYYATGMAKKYNYEFLTVKLVVLQPRGKKFGEENPEPNVVTIDMEQIFEFEKKIQKALKVAQSPNAPLKHGDWCTFCPAASICPEISENQFKNADIYFDDAGMIATPDPLVVIADKLSKYLDVVDVLEVWIKKVREHAFALAVKGEGIPNYKLVDKRSYRHWGNLPDDVALSQFGDDCFEKKLLSPSQIEKKFGKTGKEFVAEHSIKKSSGVTLVHSSDKRKEAVPNGIYDIDFEIED